MREGLAGVIADGDKRTWSDQGRPGDQSPGGWRRRWARREGWTLGWHQMWCWTETGHEEGCPLGWCSVDPYPTLGMGCKGKIKNPELFTPKVQREILWIWFIVLWQWQDCRHGHKWVFTNTVYDVSSSHEGGRCQAIALLARGMGAQQPSPSLTLLLGSAGLKQGSHGKGYPDVHIRGHQRPHSWLSLVSRDTWEAGF